MKSQFISEIRSIEVSVKPYLTGKSRKEAMMAAAGVFFLLGSGVDCRNIATVF
jgi:hypothetical protein